MSRTFAAAVLVLALTACGTSGAPSPTATSSGPGEPSPNASASAPVAPGEHPAVGLALVQFPGGADDPASQVFVVEADGSLRQVTGLGGSAGASHPAWSPDRSQIAIGPPKVGSSGIVGQVSVVNADGTGERSLGVGENPRWSPDGTRLLVAEVDDVTTDPRSMWIIDVGTGELTDLGLGFIAQWMADGERISFRRILDTADGSFADGLFVMTLATGETQELETRSESDAVWAPDGSGMLVSHDGSLAVAEPDGSGARDLVEGFAPVWAPDSSRVVFAYDVDQDATPVLAAVDLEGEALWSGTVGANPTWSPDGTRIAVEIPVPEPMVRVLDAASGDVLWEIEGMEPAW